jgi:predicted RNase H-like HicB family nuclease
MRLEHPTSSSNNQNYLHSYLLQASNIWKQMPDISASSYTAPIRKSVDFAGKKHILAAMETITLHHLATVPLRTPIKIRLKPDDDGFLATYDDFPCYGYGNTRDEAIAEIKEMLEDFWRDLNTEPHIANVSLKFKKILNEMVGVNDSSRLVTQE